MRYRRVLLPFLYKSLEIHTILAEFVGQCRTIFPSISANTMKGGGKIAKIAIRVPEENKETLAAIVKQTDKTISKLIRDMIAEYIP